ncbi:MAG: hypothetical protein H9535_08235 [Ignavibacteria bacterium]|nr:hypothetical protein [Ignavibacteria bacterium]
MYELVKINPTLGNIIIQFNMPSWQYDKVLVRYRFRLRNGNQVTNSTLGDNKILSDDIFEPFQLNQYLSAMLECKIQTMTLDGYEEGKKITIGLRQQKSTGNINKPYVFTIPIGSSSDEYVTEFTL